MDFDEWRKTAGMKGQDKEDAMREAWEAATKAEREARAKETEPQPSKWMLSIVCKPPASGVYEVRLSLDADEVHLIEFDANHGVWLSGDPDPKRAALLLPPLAVWKIQA